MRTPRAPRLTLTFVTLGAILVFSFFVSALTATAYTVVVGGQVTSQGSATITNTITITNLTYLPQDAYVTYNSPVIENFADDGFYQTIAWQQPTVNPAPLSATDMQESSGNLNIHYTQYKWSLNDLPGSTFTITVASTFSYVVTADPRPFAFTDPFSSPGGITAGATTQADAVDKIANYVKLNEHGTCVNKANLMLSQLQAVGIQARIVQGVTIDSPYTSPEFIFDNAVYQLVESWPKELHVWVEVYYPNEDKWVPYDPALNKGFVDQRHLAMGTSTTTDNALYRVNIYANSGISRNQQMSISYTGVTDSGSYTFRYLDASPSGLDIQHSLFGRDMTDAPLPTPIPTPIPTPTPTSTPTPTPVPDVTPTPNATSTPWPNATATPTLIPTANATITPTLMPGDNSTQQVPGGTGTADNATYNISGSVIDALNKATLNGAILTIDGQPFQADASGAFTIAAANGTHMLTVSVPGYGNVSLTLTIAGADVVQNVQMSQAAGNSTAKPQTPGFEIITALAGLLIIALYRHGRA